jgi:flagellar basal body-associated protein FliL
MADNPNEADAPKKRNVKKLLLQVFALMNLLIMGSGAYLIFSLTVGYKPPMLTEADIFMDTQFQSQFKKGDPILYSLEPFTVNLLTPRHVINLEVSIELLDEDGFEEVISENPKTRDAIVRILNKKEKKDLENIQGKLFLKDQITVAINDFLDEGVVKDVYFSRFVVQAR